MKKLGFILFALVSVLILAHPAYAKTMAGYNFDNYKVSIYQGKKAPLKLTSKDNWWGFRTRIREVHSGNKIDFAGKYMVGIWGCGAGCVMGAMVDKSTGRVYDLPLDEESPQNLFCDTGDESPDEIIAYYPNSRLFITRNCDQTDVGNNQARQDFTYFVNVWNESAKRFDLIKTVHQSKMIRTDD